MHILGLGRKFWTAAKKIAETGVLPEHGLMNRASSRQKHFNEEIKEDLITFFHSGPASVC